MSGDILTFYNNQDANFPGAISLGSNISSVLPGAMRYNVNTDRFEGYLNTIQPYNNSKWAPLSFTVASSSNLGGIKVGNNLSITSDGQLNATAEGVSRKFQKTLIVSQAPNSGDYTSIGECIAEFFGYDPATSTYPSGELAGLDRTYYPFPGPDARYIILVSPGVYNESVYGTINLPPYVSLVGDGESAVFINIDSILSIRCREGNIIDKMTIDLSAVNQPSSTVPGPVVGIQLHSSSGTYNSANNVTLSNLTFTLTALRVTTSIVSASNVQGIDIYNLSTNITDLPVPASFTNQEVNIIKSVTSSINFKDSTIYLEGLRASKYVVNASSLSIINIDNCQFTVNEQNTSQLASHHNSCLNLTDTELTCNYSQIRCLGYDESLNSDTQRCYGIELDSTQSIYNTPIPTMSGVIFEHYPDGSQPDEVVVLQSIRDFTTNYTNGDYIKITGSSIAQNNCITRIINVFNELRDYGSGSLLYSIIQVEHSTEFVDDITNSAITLAILYNVSLFASQVTATNETLIFPRTSSGNLNNYRVQISNTELNGANPSLGQNALVFAFPYEIYVGKEASDYTSIRSALASITDATATRPYIVHVRPGLYTETGTLVVPSYVSLVGESSKAVIIKFDVNSAGYGSQNIAVSLASYTTISGLSLNITNGLDSGITTKMAVIASTNLGQPEISASSLVDITMTDLSIVLDAFSVTQSRVAINMFKSSYTARNISIMVTPASITPATLELIGLKQTLGSSSITNLQIATSTGASVNNASIYGLYSDRGTIQLANPVITLANSGATNSSNYGIFVTNTADTSSSGSTIASENTVITGGIIRCSAGTINRVLHAGYHSTLIVNCALTQGDYFNYQGIVHSFLKTVNCYYITTTGSSITNISPVDILGRPMIVNDSLFVGDPVGSATITGTKNMLAGIRTGTKLTSGSRNTFIGVETGQGCISGVDNVFIGQGTANSAVGSHQVIIGSEAGRQLVSGGENVVIGSLAGSNMSSGSNITVLGSRTLENASNNQDIIALGKSSARQLTGASHNIILGNNTAGSLTSGSRAILIGDDTASSMSTPSDNIIIGHTAGRNLVSGTRNTMLGNNAGQNLVSGDDNTLLGYQAGQGSTTPAFSKNTLIGAKTGQGLTSGSANTLFGANVAPNLTTGSRNIITGSQHLVYPASSPGASLTTGSDNIITGVNSASNLTVGVKNIVLGNQSGASLNGTSDTIIIGHESGSNISGSAVDDGENIVIGNYAGQQITSGRAIIIGHEAGQSATGRDICIIGNHAGKTISGPRNTLIGNYAAGVSTNPNSYPMLGADNVLIGTYSGFQIETGNFNIVIGSGDGSNGATGYNLTSGDANMLLGYRSGRNLTSGDRNVIIGSNAGSAMSESSLNLIIGNEAGVNLGTDDTSTPSNNNLIMGNYAGYNYEQATQLLLIGQNAGFEGITGDNNTYIGNDAGHENQTGSDNTMIGNRAGYNVTSSQNTMIGADAGRYSTNASENTFIGYETGRGLNELTPNTGDKNTALGYQAGQLLQDGSQNILLGYKAGQSNPNGVNNIMMGPQAGQNSTSSQSIFIGSALTDASGVGIGAQTTGNYDIFIGADAGLNNTEGMQNIAIGYMANKYNTTGSQSIAIGTQAGLNNTRGAENITIGTNTGMQNITGDKNIIIGSHAGELTGTSNKDTILIGTLAGQHNNANASIFIGKRAGQMNSTGAGNILVGPDAGAQSEQSSQNIMMGSNAGSAYLGLTSAGQNIFIGDNVARDVTLGDQNIAIGANAMLSAGNVSATIAIGFGAGQNIGNRAPVAGGDANRNIIIGYQSVGDGDINSDNILVGTQVAQHVNSPITFEGNLLMGTRAGHNANLAVNSIAIGNANQLGTGGVTNILMGTSAGDNVGTALLYYATTITNIVTGSLSVNISLPYSQAYTYFRDGDHLMIRTADAYFEPVMASIQAIAGDVSNCTVIFSSAYAGATTIFGGATFFSTALLDTRVGDQDASKASGNSMLGDNAGKNVSAGSKNIGFGTQAMYSNRIGKYNNIIGTQAGYNVVSDNNTLLGTRAGYSLDISANTVVQTATDLEFASNSNAIYSTSLSNLGDYEYGSIIEINNTTDNDGRYTVELGVNQPTDPVPSFMILEGKPMYEELGIPSTVSPNAIKINSPKYTVINQSTTGSGIYAGWFKYNNTSYNGIYTTGAPIFFMDTIKEYGSVFLITGSKYNDGLHYVDVVTSALLPTGYIATTDKLIMESFSGSTDIISRCIIATSITGNTDFGDFNYNNPMNMFFTINKGVYTASPLTEKYQLSMSFRTGVYIQSKATILDDYEQDNIIFGIGYKNNIQFATGETSQNYQVFQKITIDASLFGGYILFFNNVIIVSQIANYGPVAGEYYDIEAYNSGSLVCGSQLILIDSIEEVGGFLRYVINSEYPLPANGSVTSITFKKCQIKKLARDVTNEFAPGDIVLFNNTHEYGLKTERGAFMVRDAISPSQTDNRLLIRCDDIIPDIYYSLYETQDKLWDSDGSYSSSMQSNTAGISSTSLSNANITYRIYQTNNYADSSLVQNPSSVISGWDIFCQKETITASGSNVYSCYTGNGCIIANNLYEFSKIVAPCYILINDPSPSYYVVKENKWPFNKLVIDSAYGALNTTTITGIQVQSVSSRFDTSNLASIGNTYKMFGLNDPTQIFESDPVTRNKLFASPKAVYTDSQAFTANGYDTVITIASYDSTTANTTPGYIDGYFKHVNVSHNNVDIIPTGVLSNLTVTFNNPNATVVSNLSNLDIGDIVKLDDGITNYGYCELVTTVSNTYPSYSFNIQYTPGVTGPGHIGTTSNIICNEFKSIPTLSKSNDALINYNFRNARTLVGTNSDFLRFSQLRTLDLAPYSTNQRDIYVTDATYNYATCTMDTANAVSVLSNNVVYLRETVPNEYGNLVTSNIIASPNKYIISIGTPTLDPGNDATLQAQNISAKPTGFIDVIVNNTGTTGNSSVNWILNSNVDALMGNVSIDASTYKITISNIAPDMTYGGGIPYRNDGIGLVNKVTNTFDNILPGTYIRVWDSSHNDTYLITGKTTNTTLTYDPSFYNPGANQIISFTGGTDFRIDYGFMPNTSVANGIYPLISGQVISDRIDFNQFGHIAPYNPSNTAPVANYLAIHRLPVFSLEGLNNGAFIADEYFYYFNNYKIYDGSFKLLSNSSVATTSNSTLDFHFSGGVNNRTMMYDIGDHTLLLPATNIQNHITSSIQFIRSTGVYTVTFVNAGSGVKYIYNPSATFPIFKAGQLIRVTNSSTNDGYYLVSSANTSTTSRIYIDITYRDLSASGTPDSVNVESNVIYSSNTADVDLSVYLPGQKLKIEKTLYNDTQNVTLYNHNAKVISTEAETVPTCLYISYPSLTNESGYYCKLSKCILNDETSNIILNNVDTNITDGQMEISAQSNSFALFRDGQNLNVSNVSSQLASITIDGKPDVLTMDFNINTNTGLTTNTIPVLSFVKPVTFKTIGVPISTITDNGIVKFHYLDAQGNNLMLGSFTGQFAGATELSIQNVFIGNKVGQTNQGSGNILIGNETGFAQSPADGSSTYNNKFAVYKNNFIGVPSNPLIGGDFASGRVGINTIDPDSLLTSVLSTDTKMVINGKVRAQAFNTFTGTHIVTLVHNPNTLLEPGMLLVSTGKVNKLAIIDTIVECKLCEKALDKAVFGIYANRELASGREIYHCASVGEGCILVTNINGGPENGDYISSSIIPGYGQKQLDDILHNYTVAKITEDIDWSGVHQYVMYDGKAYKRALVACTYHCG